MKHLLFVFCVLALSILALGFGASAAQAGSLENLERERAILLDTLLNADLPAAERQSRLEISRNRLVDLERMVIRDPSLAEKNTPIVRAAFDNYDLTFLVHASVEKDRNLADHWLSEVGISSNAILGARRGRR
ncbi:MAG: hypothetical protein ACPGOV_06600 [Magnetovibrionaceae bacterium]